MPSLQEKGYRRSGSRKKPKAPAGWKVVKGADGAWWVLKPGATGRSGGGGARKTTTELVNEAWKQHTGSGGWEEQYPDDPRGAAVAFARWIREQKPQFVKTGRVVDLQKLNAVLNRIGGSVEAEARRILNGYMKTVNGKKVWK